MPNIYDYAQQFRRDLEAGATDTSLVMIKLYGDLWSTKIKPQIDSVNAEIDQDIAEGKDPTLARQSRRARVLKLQEDMRVEMVRISAQIQHMVDQDIRAVVDRAQQDAQTLMQAGINPPPGNITASFNRLPTAALENLTGALQEGSPLKKLLDNTGEGASDEVGKALLEGLALGKGPRDIARNARAALGGNMARALTIARTETLRSYREASRQTYAANPNIVKKWKWLCAKTARTCAVCWASNGEEFDTDQHMPTHPNCRCAMVPVTVSWADYAADNGIPMPPEGWPSSPDLDKLVGDGPSLFDKLSEEDQRRILGHSKYEHYKAGAFGLKDLIGRSNDPDWGRGRHERSLSEMGLDRVPFSRKSQPPTAAPPASEAEAARNQITELQQAAQARINDLNNQVAALEAEYKDLMAEYTGLMNKSYNIGGTLTEEEAARLAIVKQQRLDHLAAMSAAQEAARLEAETLVARQRALLYVSDPASVRVLGTKNALNRHKDGIDEFNKLVSSGTIGNRRNFPYQNVEIHSRLSNTGRSYYDNRGGVFMQQDSDRVVVHELGHWWEDQNYEAHKAVLEFLDRRTAGESPQWLGPGYGRQEVARPDNFIRAYMGKDYVDRQGNRYATEVVSMGLEYFHSDPHTLATQDPDYFDFIYNLVRGNY